jgi:hypothetical protein
MDLELNTTQVNVYLEDGNVVVRGVDLQEVIGQIEINELLDAIKDADQFSAMADYVTKELKGEDE